MYKVSSIVILCTLLSVAVVAQDKVIITSDYPVTVKDFDNWYYEWVGTIAPSLAGSITPGMVIPIRSIIDDIQGGAHEQLASDSPVVDAQSLWIDVDCAGHPIDLFVVYDKQHNFVGISIKPSDKSSEEHGAYLRRDGSIVEEKAVVHKGRFLSGIKHFVAAGKKCFFKAKSAMDCISYFANDETTSSIVDSVRNFLCGGD